MSYEIITKFLKNLFYYFCFFIYCGNSEARETISSEQNIGGINNISLETSSLDATTTTVFSSSPVSSVLKISKTSETTTTTVPQTTKIGITVANNGQGFNEYFLNGTSVLTLNVTIGNKYRFDLSDTSNAGHPLRFSETQNGSQYTSNVTTNGVAGTPGAYIEIEITSNTPNQLYIYCENHFGMGGDTKILTP